MMMAAVVMDVGVVVVVVLMFVLDRVSVMDLVLIEEDSFACLLFLGLVFKEGFGNCFVSGV